MSVTPSVKYVKVSGAMVAKPVNVRSGGLWKPVQNVTAELYLSPSGTTYHVNDTLTVTVRETSFTTAVNAVQVNLTYNPSALQFQSADPSAGAFTTALQNTGGSGSVQLQLGTISGSSTGDQLVATVNFTVLATGAANVTFTTGCQIYRSSDSVNVCNQTLGTTYTVS